MRWESTSLVAQVLDVADDRDGFINLAGGKEALD